MLDSVFTAVRLWSNEAVSQIVERDETEYFLAEAIEINTAGFVSNYFESSSCCHGTGRLVEFWYLSSL